MNDIVSQQEEVNLFSLSWFCQSVFLQSDSMSNTWPKCFFKPEFLRYCHRTHSLRDRCCEHKTVVYKFLFRLRVYFY